MTPAFNVSAESFPLLFLVYLAMMYFIPITTGFAKTIHLALDCNSIIEAAVTSVFNCNPKFDVVTCKRYVVISLISLVAALLMRLLLHYYFNISTKDCNIYQLSLILPQLNKEG